MVKKKSEIDLEGLTEDELETLLALIRLGLIDNLIDCDSCLGDKGCC